MASVTTNDLRITNAKNFVSYLGQDTSYMFIGRPTRWEESDNNPPYPENNWKDFYKVWDQMLAMNKINVREVFHMIPRLNWSSGTTYDMYRHDYKEDNRSFTNASNIYNAFFFVVSQNNNVYVCLDNNKNQPSTVEPLAESDEPFYTSDDYQWVRIYTLSSYILGTKGTNNFMPIINEGINKLEDGGVYTTIINSPGDDYTSFPRGVDNNIPYYYCHITGDGTGAVARVAVANGKVYEVRVVRPGSGYTVASVDFKANRCYGSLVDLDSVQNGLNPLGDGTFSAIGIISPPGGWGTDLVRELGGTRIGVFSDFRSTNTDYIVESEFRQVGVMSEVTTETPTTDSLSCVYAVTVGEVSGSANQDYTMYETITQTTDGVVAKGQVVGWDDQKNIIRYIQDPTLHSDDNGQMNRFMGGAVIIGEESGKETIPNQLTEGDFDDLLFVGGYASPEVKKYSGHMNYVTNLSPIKRAPEQSERVSLIISY